MFTFSIEIFKGRILSRIPDIQAIFVGHRLLQGLREDGIMFCILFCVQAERNIIFLLPALCALIGHKFKKKQNVTTFTTDSV